MEVIVKGETNLEWIAKEVNHEYQLCLRLTALVGPVAHLTNLPFLTFPLEKKPTGTMAHLFSEHAWRNGLVQNKR